MLSQQLQETFRQKLHAMRGRMDERASLLRQEISLGTGGEASGGISNTPVHLGDLGTQEAEIAVNVGLAEKEASMRQEIDNALERLDAGNFGVCEECDDVIASGRLEALPYSRLCIQCANQMHLATSH